MAGWFDNSKHLIDVVSQQDDNAIVSDSLYFPLF
jgi:hypothetical protein